MIKTSTTAVEEVTPDMSSRKIASTREVIAMSKLMSEHLHQVDPDKNLWQYEDGWSDELVASSVSTELKASHAIRVRREMHGELRPAYRKTDPDVKNRIKELEERIAAIEKRLGETLVMMNRLGALEEFHAKLCQTLTINKVIGVNHLAGKPSLRAVEAR